MAILLVLCILVLLVIAASYVCCRFCFLSQNRQKKIFSACRTRSSMPRIGKR